MQIFRAVQATGEQFHPTSVDDDTVENDPEEENLEQSSNDLKTASKRADVAEQLKVCYLICILCETDVLCSDHLGEFS